MGICSSAAEQRAAELLLPPVATRPPRGASSGARSGRLCVLVTSRLRSASDRCRVRQLRSPAAAARPPGSRGRLTTPRSRAVAIRSAPLRVWPATVRGCAGAAPGSSCWRCSPDASMRPAPGCRQLVELRARSDARGRRFSPRRGQPPSVASRSARPRGRIARRPGGPIRYRRRAPSPSNHRVERSRLDDRRRRRPSAVSTTRDARRDSCDRSSSIMIPSLSAEPTIVQPGRTGQPTRSVSRARQIHADGVHVR